MKADMYQKQLNKEYFTTRTAKRVSSLFVFAIIFCIVFTGCNQTTYVENENVKVFVDERAEFLNVVQYLAAHNVYTNIGQVRKYSDLTVEYTTDIESSFLKYKQHTAVLKVNEFLGDRVLAEGMMATFLGAFNGDFTLNKDYLDTEPEIIAAWGGIERFESLSKELSSLYEEINFSDFFNKYKSWLDKFADDARKKVVDTGDINHLIDYFSKEDIAEYHIILSPLSSIMSGFSIVNEDDSETPTVIMGIPRKISEWKYILFHELSYGYTGDLGKTLSDKESDLLKYVPILESIDDFYNYRVVSEERRVIRAIDGYVAHAVSLRLVELNIGSKESKGFANEVKKIGYIYINEVCEKLKEYENNRDKYPTFDDFTPEIISLFDKLAEEHADGN